MVENKKDKPKKQFDLKLSPDKAKKLPANEQKSIDLMKMDDDGWQKDNKITREKQKAKPE